MRMRKTSNTRFAYKLDKIFWFLLTFLPVILYAIYLFSNKATSYLDFSKFLQTIFNYDYPTGISANPIYKVLASLFSFGDTGVFPILPFSFLYLFAYMATVEVIHVAFDVIVFIPRLAHKWISKAVQDD